MERDMKLSDISNFGEIDTDGCYIVATDTPDGGKSTFGECWGCHAKYSARAVWAGDSIVQAIAEAERWGWRKYPTGWASATIMDRRTGKPVGQNRLKPYL